MPASISQVFVLGTQPEVMYFNPNPAVQRSGCPVAG